MPWVANNNQAGDVRAPALSAALRLQKLKQQAYAGTRRDWTLPLCAVAIEQLSAGVDRVAARGCALMHPEDFPGEDAAAGGVEFVFPRVHAYFVVAVRAHAAVPRGCIALAQPQLINLEMCVDQVETWSLFQEPVPSINAVAVEIRPLGRLDDDTPLSVDAKEFATAFATYCWQRILTENERLTMVFGGEVEYFVRVLEIDAADDSETDFTMPDSFRGLVDEDTQVFVSVDGVDSEAFRLTNQTPRPQGQSLTALRSDVVVVTTSDDEEFPVKKKLLFPCIKLSSAVLAGRGVHKDASSSIQVDIDCLTFDRVLLYLEHEARNDGTEYKFDPQYTEELLSCGEQLGCIGLQDVCKRRLGEFETRVRKDPIRWEEVVRRNTSGEIWLVMQGMVFDVTRWLPEHPGGSVIIPREAVNVDCTVMFEIYHSSRQSFRYLKQFYIGEIAEADLPMVPKSTETPSPAFVEEFTEVKPVEDACFLSTFSLLTVSLCFAPIHSTHRGGLHRLCRRSRVSNPCVALCANEALVSPHSSHPAIDSDRSRRTLWQVQYSLHEAHSLRRVRRERLAYCVAPRRDDSGGTRSKRTKRCVGSAGVLHGIGRASCAPVTRQARAARDAVARVLACRTRRLLRGCRASGTYVPILASAGARD
jgi:cytochrome b involved in lipid metabolism